MSTMELEALERTAEIEKMNARRSNNVVGGWARLVHGLYSTRWFGLMMETLISMRCV